MMRFRTTHGTIQEHTPWGVAASGWMRATLDAGRTLTLATLAPKLLLADLNVAKRSVSRERRPVTGPVVAPLPIYSASAGSDDPIDRRAA